ncbi:MAG: rhomboid family intramembrane serine protease [Propionibacteriales bacterium]|nr:rhomboid family intramembrane serine protease [Propionibacteriales bacterium]
MSSSGQPGPEFEGPIFDGPGAPEPDFQPCYLHPDRQTGIFCQRCGRPICGQCMIQASVGFQCPNCVHAGRESGRQPRNATGAKLTDRMEIGRSPVTWAVAGAWLVIMVLDLFTRGLLSGQLALITPLVESGQFWRLLTFGLTVGGFLNLVIHVLIMVMIGRGLEPEVGTWRYLGILGAATLVGGTLFFLIAPDGGVVPGATASILGLIAAYAALKLRRGADIRGDLLMLALMVGFSFIVGMGSFYWLVQLGGVLGGGAAGMVLAWAPRERRNLIQGLGLAGIAVVCLLAVMGRVAIG